MVVTARKDLVFAAGVCLFALAGCGAATAGERSTRPVVPPLAGTEPNGEQLKTGSQLLADARDSVDRAATVHLTGSFVLQGVATPIDVISDRSGDVTGSLGNIKGALQIQFDKAGDAVFVRPTGNAARLVSRLGLPRDIATPAAQGEAWLLDATDAAPVMALTSLALPALSGTLLPVTLVASPTLTSGDVDGTPVVTAIPGQPALDDVPQAASFSVSVAVTGPVRLVRISGGTPAAALTVEVGTAVQPALPTPAATPNP